jgi:hypothetical protein
MDRGRAGLFGEEFTDSWVVTGLTGFAAAFADRGLRKGVIVLATSSHRPASGNSGSFLLTPDLQV